MTVESVRAFFADNAPDISVIESDKSSATVALAAEAFGVTKRSTPPAIRSAGSVRSG
jgi:prolyl-tRNA editing enzyme YbaK/EbsC (Cys-tRNA(Pro) deacylase)